MLLQIHQLESFERSFENRQRRRARSRAALRGAAARAREALPAAESKAHIAPVGKFLYGGSSPEGFNTHACMPRNLGREKKSIDKLQIIECCAAFDQPFSPPEPLPSSCGFDRLRNTNEWLLSIQDLACLIADLHGCYASPVAAARFFLSPCSRDGL
jgi:hypothetical protein